MNTTSKDIDAIAELKRMSKTLADMATMEGSPSRKQLLDTLAVALLRNTEALALQGKPTTPDGETPRTDAIRLTNDSGDWVKESDKLKCALAHADALERELHQLEKEKRELAAEVEQAKADRNRIGMQVRSELFSVIQKKDEQINALLLAGNELAECALNIGHTSVGVVSVILRTGQALTNWQNLTKEKK
jgi:hypothetical protein